MYKFKKTAGLILDQQDDPGAGWELISEYWPDDLEPPLHGVEISKQACAITMTDGISKIARYPVDTPTNALASSMYFLAFGLDSIEDPEEFKKIAHDLQEYRIAHGVHLPEGFVDELRFIKEAGEVEPEESFADEDGHLPVTTPEQAEASIALFSKNAELWPAADRMLCSARLEKAAEFHGIECELPYAGKELSKNASGAIGLRISIMEHLSPNGLEENPYDNYIESMEHIKQATLQDQSYEDLLKIAADIEALDVEYGMDEAWDVQFPNPVDTLLTGWNADPFAAVEEKTASFDWDSVDWTDLPFEDSVIDAIKVDPEVIVPTLPTPQRKLVEDYVYGKSKV